MMIRCPVCKNRHSVQNNYDNSDFICPNSNNGKTFRQLQPEGLLDGKSSMMNRSSTRVNESRPVTIIISEPDFDTMGERIISRRRTNW